MVKWKDAKQKNERTVSVSNRNVMFGLFKKKSEKEKLEEKYRKLIDESYKLSHSNRSASDQKAAEADAVLKQIEAL